MKISRRLFFENLGLITGRGTAGSGRCTCNAEFRRVQISYGPP